MNSYQRRLAEIKELEEQIIKMRGEKGLWIAVGTGIMGISIAIGFIIDQVLL